MAQAVIGCKLPNGIVLNIDGATVEVQGRNQSLIKDRTGRGMSDGKTTVTNVDGEKVKAWFDRHEHNFKPITSGAIYLASSEKDAESKARQNESKKTGQEPVDPKKPAKGVEKVDNS